VPWICLLIVTFMLYYFRSGLIHDFVGRVELANHIMCGGNKNFVYTRNPASGIIMATPTSAHSEDHDEQQDWNTVATILNLAQLDLQDGHGFKVPPSLVGIAEKPKTAMVKIGPSVAVEEWARAGTYEGLFNQSLGTLPAEHWPFECLWTLSTRGRKHAADTIPCTDGAGAQSVHALRAKVEKTLGYSTAAMMHQTPREICQSLVDKCGLMNMTALRALCPTSCGCHMWRDIPAGFYAVDNFGCPSACNTMMTAMRKSGRLGMDNCTDVTPSEFASKGLVNYMRSASDYVTANPEFAQAMEQTLRFFLSNNVLDYTEEVSRKLLSRLKNMVDFLLSDAFVEGMYNGTWEFNAGVPHPRRLKGCDFVTSWEFAALFQLDLCEVGAGFRSIRTYCPEACKCSPGLPECPIIGCWSTPSASEFFTPAPMLVSPMPTFAPMPTVA